MYLQIFLYTRGTRSTVKEISKEKIRWKGNKNKTSKDEEAKVWSSVFNVRLPASFFFIFVFLIDKSTFASYFFC